jgi:four helix bundle protein
MRKNVIQEKSFSFAVQVVILCNELHRQRQHVIANQLLRSGTSIGANVEEALAAQSRRDFLSKMSIASKEARETLFWLRVLRASRTTSIELAEPLSKSAELVRILTAIVKSTGQDPPIQN